MKVVYSRLQPKTNGWNICPYKKELFIRGFEHKCDHPTVTYRRISVPIPPTIKEEWLLEEKMRAEFPWGLYKRARGNGRLFVYWKAGRFTKEQEDNLIKEMEKYTEVRRESDCKIYHGARGNYGSLID